MHLAFTVMTFAALFVMAAVLSNNRSLGPFRDSAINPVLLMTAFIALAGADFISVAAKGYGVLGQRTIAVSPERFLTLQFAYGAMIFMFLLGIAVAFAIRQAPRPDFRRRVVDFRVEAVAIYFIVLIIFGYLIYALGGSVGDFENAVEVKVDSARDIPIIIASLMLLPAFTYAIIRQPLKITMALLVISLVIVLSSGSRTRVLYLLVPLAFYIIRVRGFKLNRKFFIVGAMVVAVFSVVSVNYRYAVQYDKVPRFENLLFRASLLETGDISFAETTIAASRLPRKQLESYPGRNLVGMAFAPFPRAMVPFKPQTGSNEFTEVYDKERWLKFRSAFTIGAFNELRYDYPIPLAGFVSFLLGLAWALAFRRAANSKSVHGFAFSVGLYLALYQFLKADIQAAGAVIWVFVIVATIIRAIENAKGGTQRVAGPAREAPGQRIAAPLGNGQRSLG